MESDREKIAVWMRCHGFVTGHGDDVDGLLKELSWQLAEERSRGNSRTSQSAAAQGTKP